MTFNDNYCNKRFFGYTPYSNQHKYQNEIEMQKLCLEKKFQTVYKQILESHCSSNINKPNSNEENVPSNNLNQTNINGRFVSQSVYRGTVSYDFLSSSVMCHQCRQQYNSRQGACEHCVILSTCKNCNEKCCYEYSLACLYCETNGSYKDYNEKHVTSYAKWRAKKRYQRIMERKMINL